MKSVHCIYLLLTVALTAVLQAQTTTLLPNGATWKYLDDASDQGTAWRSPAFDDSTWAAGPSPLGYGGGDEATVVNFVDTDPVTTGTQKNATTYFRTSVNIATPSQYQGIRLSLTYDDSAAIYLNGVEVARTSNLPAAAAFDTFATSSSSDGANKAWVLPTTAFVDGINFIAVEIHQSNATSSDISFDLQIAGLSDVIRGPYLLMNTNSAMTIRWRTNSPSDSVVKIGSAVGALTNTITEPAITTEHEVRVTNLLPDTKYFYAIGSTATTMAGDTAEHFFRTAPVPGTDRPMRLWALGDAGTANSNQRHVRDAYLQSPHYKFNDMLLLLGDNAYNAGQDSEYQSALFDMYPTVLQQTPVWSCLGNHETDQVRTGSYTGVPYFDIFSFPTAAECGGYASGTERYYSWEFGNVHFISLDVQTNNAALRTNMLAWLANDLAANTRRWTIAIWHHPPYTKGSHDSDQESQPTWARQFLAPMMDDGGVDLVLCGHSHCYERSHLIEGFYATPTLATSGNFVNAGDGKRDGDGEYGKDYGAHKGVVYVVAGSSGQATSWTDNSTVKFNPHPHPVMHHSELQLGSLFFDIDGNRLDAKFITSTGSVDDYFSIDKGPLITVAATVPSAAEYGPTPGQISIARSGSTDAPLNVLATIGGTAASSRYEPITVPVTIPVGAATSVINVTPQLDTLVQGAETVILTGDPNIEYRLGAQSSGTVTITDAPPGAPPIVAWHLEKFGLNANNETIRGDNADPDSDGADNLMEYALGLDPLIPTFSGWPNSAVSSDFLTMDVQRNPAATDIDYTVLVSDDLVDWSDVDTTILQDTPSLLRVRDNKPFSMLKRRFMRLRITRP
jgi:hypothetical protein